MAVIKQFATQAVMIQAGKASLRGDLTTAERAQGIVVFAHGSGSSRLSPRNQYVASVLNEAGLATLLMDLLTSDEEAIDLHTRAFRFDIRLLADRLVGTIDWVVQQPETSALRIGLFGASTGAAAALIAAQARPERIGAVVSRGGRPDLAGQALEAVQAPTLLIVGGNDRAVIELNRDAARRMAIEPRIEIVPGATHLFEEPGKLDEVARLARRWFEEHLLQ